MDRASTIPGAPIELKAKSHVHVALFVAYAGRLKVGDWFRDGGGAWCVVRAYAGCCCSIYSGPYGVHVHWIWTYSLALCII